MIFLLSSKKNYKIWPWLRVVSLSISVIWCYPQRETQNIKWFISHYDFRMRCDSPLSLHNPDGGGRDVTPQNEIWGQNQITWTEVSISGYDFRTGCNPPLLLSLHYTEGGRRVTPQNEIRGQNQITWTEVSISLHDFGMGCDPPPSLDHLN